MGRRTSADELLAQATAKGYKKGARADVDSIKNREKHVKKIRRDQDRTLRRYVLYVEQELQDSYPYSGDP
jgi:hypothetical protein